MATVEIEPNNDQAAVCGRCARKLTAEPPIRLPDTRTYCTACCESMASDTFEMETGESFSRWIAKHPKLVMQYQPLELSVRRMSFFFQLLICALGAGMLVYGIAAGETLPRKLGYICVGAIVFLSFAALSLRAATDYLRAVNFKLILDEGTFSLQHGTRQETFSVDDVTQACVVRPGTVGATEGALGLKDGRMLTLDTCLSDLHALGVVMDLRFKADFPPSADELAKIRRDKLRKIRGLS
jgi:hypothetical protein